ncbi:ogr/Delta-like zinc finger family protein [Psychrobacter sp. 72-O-c]|uniref:ogr/Delta-like zinc finger family protein n=1 Tax=Psychrobacter sp. 72-O-c TaxID=2774125 RepID=UPI00191A1209|nr:ogr/Delta-like zinc finger family protein [Psychrobacter sp. 72-O-c]
MASPTSPTAYINCPHCAGRMRTYGHVMFSALTKQLVAACQNPDCLFSARVGIEITQQLQPSLCPNPDIAAALTR